MLIKIIAGPGTGQVIDMVDYMARARILNGLAIPVTVEPERPAIDVVGMFERRYEQVRTFLVKKQ